MKLKAKSARGKQLIKDFGDKWEIKCTSLVQFADGLHWFITSVSKEGSHTRWMRPRGDKHLEVVGDIEGISNIVENQPGMYISNRLAKV